MKQAIALQYDPGAHECPLVVASAEGDVAARIERAALAWGVPVVRDVPLAVALSGLSVGDPIPEALYESVAAVLTELSAMEPAP